MRLQSSPLPEFWQCYNALPIELQEQADKQFELFDAEPFHPSLRFKQTGRYWSARVTRSVRVLARRRGDNVYWFWIGGHDEYERLIRT